ncbi:MAG: arginase family protein [Prevotellaceae bacterium]|jgi:agmatinase|nr:arginase family protein [Prevotellaceae bacterium]
MENFSGLKGAFTDSNESKFFVLPVPYSTQNDWNSTANKAPEAIIEASQHFEYFDTETTTQVYLKGIYTLEPLNNLISDEKVCSSVEKKVGEILELGKFPVVLGGNRTVCIGAMRAACAKTEDITIIQFGANNSMRVNYKGSEYAPECAMYQAKKLAPLTQIGIRSMSADGKRNSDMARMFFARDIFFDQSNRWVNEVFDTLSSKNTYITIDLKVFDPSVMPSVSVPEPGGLQYFTMLKLLKQIFQQTNVVGFDVVGLCPNPYDKSPDCLAARLIYQMMTYKAVHSFELKTKS